MFAFFVYIIKGNKNFHCLNFLMVFNCNFFKWAQHKFTKQYLSF